MTDTPYADPALLPVGTHHVFTRLGIERTFTRVPGGWNGAGRYLDDVSIEEDGWRYVRPAD